jgi:predicted NBD/HSP70 family sugar kinase
MFRTVNDHVAKDGLRGLKALRARNVDAILAALDDGPLSQAEIARRAGLSGATVSNLVSVMEVSGDVTIETGQMNGRRSNLVARHRANRPWAIGVYANRVSIRVAGVSPDGTLTDQESVPRRLDATYEEELGDIIRLVEEVRSRGTLPAAALAGIGVAVCTTVDPLIDRPVIGFPYFHWFDSWDGQDLAADLAERFGVTTSLANDGECGALAEATWGAGSGASDILYVHLSDGVGGGILLNGRLHRGGGGGFAGELGHLSSNLNGTLCICGNRGCVETMFGTALATAVADVHADLDIGSFARLARSGDAACARVISEAAAALAAALGSAVALLAPERVIIGGTLAQAGDALLDPIARWMRDSVSLQIWRGEVVLGDGTNDNVILGAAHMSLQRTNA